MFYLLSGLVGFSLVILFCGLILSRILFWQLFSPLLQLFPHLYRSFLDLATEVDVPAQWFEGLRDLRQSGLDRIAWVCAVQLAALGQQIRHGLFLRLAVGIQLANRVDFVAR